MVSIAISGVIELYFIMEETIKQNVCSFHSLFKGMNKCKNGVMWKDSTAKFVSNGLINCYKIKNELVNGQYELRPYSRFIITEPKEREIVATKMRDRVFQRSLCDNYLYHEITKRFIYDNGACQTGKGTDFSRKRLMVHMERHYRRHGANGWVLQCDIRRFFPSIPHETALSVLRKYVKDDWAYKECERVIRSFAADDSPDKGLGLGSQISQLAALAVLNEIDHFIKEQLHIKCYIRYMDDFILISDSLPYLKHCLRRIKEKIEAAGLRLNVKKTHIYPFRHPIKFLGFSFRITDTGKVIREVLPQKISHERRKLKGQSRQVHARRMSTRHLRECFLSHLSHLKYGNNYTVIRHMIVFYNKITESIKGAC